jgi:hypothetical protein
MFYWQISDVLSAHKETEMNRESFDADDESDKAIDFGLLGPIEKIHHDLHEENVTAERYHQAEEFIRACECVAVWRLKQGRLPGDASHYLAELVARLAETVRTLTEADDIMLARRLPPTVAVMRRAESVFGKKLTNEITEQLPIEEILKEHRAIDLIQMFAALHPDWAELCGIEDGEKLLQQPENELRELLMSKETWTGTRNGVEFEEKRKHRLAQLIEQAQAIREMQQPNINCFVEHLRQGRLWSGPNGTYEDCPWPTRPPREDVPAWMALIMPYLKTVTNNDATKLGVFRYMIAARSYCFDGEKFDATKGKRLAEARPSDIWNQVRAEIQKAWIRMEKQARKPVFEKSA